MHTCCNLLLRSLLSSSVITNVPSEFMCMHILYTEAFSHFPATQYMYIRLKSETVAIIGAQISFTCNTDSPPLNVSFSTFLLATSTLVTSFLDGVFLHCIAFLYMHEMWRSAAKSRRNIGEMSEFQGICKAIIT